MRRIGYCATGLLIILLCSCATIKPPVVTIPPPPALPGVAWHGHNPDGSLCVDAQNATALRQREELRDAYEDALRALLHAYGATDAPK